MRNGIIPLILSFSISISFSLSSLFSFVFCICVAESCIYMVSTRHEKDGLSNLPKANAYP